MVLVNDIFDGGKQFSWAEHAERTRDENNAVSAAGKLNLLSVNNYSVKDVKVGVWATGNACAGIVLRFKDKATSSSRRGAPRTAGRSSSARRSTATGCRMLRGSRPKA